jgi:hypothetical protein
LIEAQHDGIEEEEIVKILKKESEMITCNRQPSPKLILLKGGIYGKCSSNNG